MLNLKEIAINILEDMDGWVVPSPCVEVREVDVHDFPEPTVIGKERKIFLQDIEVWKTADLATLVAQLLPQWLVARDLAEADSHADDGKLIDDRDRND